MRTRVFTLFFWIGIGAIFLFPINASDFYHHLNTGRSIVQDHALPYTDTLSFTAFGRPWVAYAWGTGLVYYALYTTAGPIGISLFTALLGIGTIWMLFSISKKLNVPNDLSYTISAFTAALLSLRWPTRPEIFSPFFIAVILFTLTAKTRLSLWHILIFFLWGILYGSSAFLGVCILALFILLVSHAKIRDSAILIASIVASSSNGYGISSFLYILQIPAIAPHTGEWLPLFQTLNPQIADLVLFYQWQVASYIVYTVIVVMVSVMFFRRKGMSRDVWMYLIISLSIFLPFQSVRFINLSPVLCAPLLYYALGSAKGAKRIFIVGFIGILAVGISLVRLATFSVGSGEEFSKKPMQFLRSHSISGNIMSIQEMGAHISWELPNSKVLYDTRDDLYQPTGIFSEIQQLDMGNASIVAFTNKYGISIVLGDPTTGSVYKPLIYSPDWSLVYISDGSFILVKNKIAIEKKLKEFDAIDPLRSPSAKSGETQRAYDQMKYIHLLDPASEELRVRLAELALILRKTDEIRPLIKDIALPNRFRVRWGMETVSTAEMLGKFALESGDCVNAKSLLSLAESTSYGQLIFSPKTRLPNTTDRYLGQYFQRCENNTTKAREYYSKALKSTNNPLEQRAIEQQILAL